MAWGRHSLSCILGHHVEVVEFSSHGVIKNCSWLRVPESSVIIDHEFSLDSLVHHHEGKGKLLCFSFAVQGSLYLTDLVLHDCVNLAFTDSISEEY
jgi:hypothetical protein